MARRAVLALAMALAALCHSLGFGFVGDLQPSRTRQVAAQAEAKKAPKKKAKACWAKVREARGGMPCGQVAVHLPGTLGGPKEGLLGEDPATRVLLVPAARPSCAPWPEKGLSEPQCVTIAARVFKFPIAFATQEREPKA